jgi:hypothetical protein
MHGMYDSYFPPATAAEGAKSLTRSFVYTVAGGAYNVLGQNCTISIRNAWIANPAVAPDVSCLANLPKTVTPFRLTSTSY